MPAAACTALHTPLRRPPSRVGVGVFQALQRQQTARPPVRHPPKV